MIVIETEDFLGGTWSKDESRSSSVYARSIPVAVTLGTDVTDNGRRVVRLTLFVRGR